MKGDKSGEPDPLAVLIVDDNRDIADSLALLLRLWGFEVSVAYDGVSGLELARERHPDCLLLDIGMPGMNGYELSRLIRQEAGLEKTKLIAHTAYSNEDHKRKISEAGFDYRLTKPATPGELEALLRMIDQIRTLAEQTEDLARRNVDLANETKDLLAEVSEDIKEVRDDLKEIKQDIKDIKDKMEDH